MPVSNIVDKRTNKYDVNCMIVLENSWHDNSIEGATQFDESEEDITCIYIKQTTVQRAIACVNLHYKIHITVFLYDVHDDEHFDYQTITDDLQLI